jgi:RNA polymerase sigma factor (TIGR02999 family)
MESSAIASALQSGNRESIERLAPRLYDQLRIIASRQLGKRPNGGTLRTTELVHEAYLKVLGSGPVEAVDQSHFLALTSLAMRHVLVDRAKARGRLKRGAGGTEITFDEERIAVADRADALLDLDEALTWLAEMEPRMARVVECRFFGGLTAEQIAEALGVTVRTVERDWAKARMLLRRQLES